MKVEFIKWADKLFGNQICRILGLFARKRNIHKAKSVLFIQLWGVGETILTLPAIKAFHNKYPHSRIHVLCTKRNMDVFTGIDFINNIHVLGISPFAIIKFLFLNFGKYDLVIDFEEYLTISSIIAFFAGKSSVGYSGQVRSRLYTKSTRYNDMQHVVQTHLDLVRLAGADANPKSLEKLYVSDDDKKSVDLLLAKQKLHKNTNFIGICVGTAESAKSRMWPEARFAKLADKLIGKYKLKIVFVGAPNERRRIVKITSLMAHNAINTAGMTTLKQSFYLISRSKLFISNDTGPMHVAAAMGVPTIGLFGPNLPVRWKPFGENNYAIYKDGACRFSPCINVHKAEVPECRFGANNKCMKAIEVEDVLNCADKILGTKN